MSYLTSLVCYLFIGAICSGVYRWIYHSEFETVGKNRKAHESFASAIVFLWPVALFFDIIPCIISFTLVYLEKRGGVVKETPPLVDLIETPPEEKVLDIDDWLDEPDLKTKPIDDKALVGTLKSKGGKLFVKCPGGYEPVTRF
ncbi:MAG: hypothetical protein WC511_02425 [Candidatus Pacearchaeota archaeon]